MFNRKYKLVGKTKFTVSQTSNGVVKNVVVDSYRIQALRDIPLSDVKAGDLGGYVTGKDILSQKGNCWVGGNAFVGRTEDKPKSIIFNRWNSINGNTEDIDFLVTGDSIVTDDAIVSDSFIKHEVVIRGNAQVMSSKLSGFLLVEGQAKMLGVRVLAKTFEPRSLIAGHSYLLNASLSGYFTVKDNAQIRGGAKLDGKFTVKDNATILRSELTGNFLVSGISSINHGVKISGNSSITGSAQIPEYFVGRDVVISQGTAVMATDVKASHPTVERISKIPVGEPEDTTQLGYAKELKRIRRVESRYNSYTQDIVEMLKYPAMLDTSIPEVKKFVLNLRHAKEDIEDNDYSEISEHVLKIEESFLEAETKVLTLAQSHLGESAKNSIKKANQLLSLASNEAGTDNERALSFKAGFKALEGVLPVDDKVVESFKTKIGLLEIEA